MKEKHIYPSLARHRLHVRREILGGYVTWKETQTIWELSCHVFSTLSKPEGEKNHYYMFKEVIRIQYFKN